MGTKGLFASPSPGWKGRKMASIACFAGIVCLSLIWGIGISACSDDDPVKKNPYLQVVTRALLKEQVKVVFNNIDNNLDVTVDFGDGTVLTGRGGNPIIHAYEQSGDYTLQVTAGEYSVSKRIRVYKLLALTEAMKQFKETSNKTVWALAHRAHTTDRNIPENSVSAVKAAIAAGADVVECDTHRTSDGVIVVCHDQWIDATTDGTGDITKMTYADIQKYNLKNRDGKVTSEKMPTLEEFLKAGRGKVYFNLDYSPRTASTEEVLSIVKSLDMMESVFFYCNGADKVQEVLSLDAGAHVYPWGSPDVYAPLLKRDGVYFAQLNFNPNGNNNAGSVVSDGLVLTANMLNVQYQEIPEFALDNGLLDRLLAAYPQVHMIQTDVPGLLIGRLKDLGRR